MECVRLKWNGIREYKGEVFLLNRKRNAIVKLKRRVRERETEI